MASQSQPADQTPLLAAHRIGRRHPQQPGWLLEDLSLQVFTGDRLFLQGPTGSGKTLLLRAMSLLDPIDVGEILWQGEPVADEDVPAFRAQVAYLLQKPIVRPGTVRSNLEHPFGMGTHRDKTYAEDWLIEMLADVDLAPSFLDKPAQTLSGGESQIVALLRVLQLAPRVLLLDEPTAALDAQATAQIEQLLLDWFNRQNGRCAYVWVSHVQEQQQRIANRTVRLRGGKRVEDETL